MIYVTGDCHGNFRRFGRRYFSEQGIMSRTDYVIICGDFGGLWDGSKQENYWLDWLNEKPWTTLWVDGNHENYAMLYAIPTEQWHGGLVHRVRPNILHLMRGQIYEIEGHTFFTMGGARSHDIEDGILDSKAPDFKQKHRILTRQKRLRFRVLGKSWWPEEMPSDTEYIAALESLERVNWEVDYILTHCAPTSIVREMSSYYELDVLSDFLELIDQRVECRYWLFGHYHDNQIIREKYILLWEQIVRLI